MIRVLLNRWVLPRAFSSTIVQNMNFKEDRYGFKRYPMASISNNKTLLVAASLLKFYSFIAKHGSIYGRMERSGTYLMYGKHDCVKMIIF
ncbi:hypothetical protein R6Q59_021694 [Mikania micrantha]